MKLPDANELQKFGGCFLDWLFVTIERSTGFILIAMFLCVPIIIAALEESVTTTPTEPRGDCIGIMSADSPSHWARIGCFIQDQSANWGDNIVKFFPAVSRDCKIVAEIKAKEECEEGKRRRVNEVAKHMAILAAGVVIGGGFGR